MISPDIIKQQTEEWLNNFLKIYPSEEITPYMHIFVSHLHQFSRIYFDIHKFNMQGVEKTNDKLIQAYFGGTNKQINYNTFLLQLAKKRNRIEIFSFSEYLLESF
jgi:hypothetical protein